MRTREVSLEPVARELRHALEGARLFEEMRSARNDLQMSLAAQGAEGSAIHLYYGDIGAADDQQGRSHDAL